MAPGWDYGELNSERLLSHKKLEELDLRGISFMQQDPDNDVTLASANTVRSINFTRVQGLQLLESWLQERDEPSQFFPRLERLTFDDCSSDYAVLLHILTAGSGATAANNLKYLSIDATSYDQDEIEQILSSSRLLGMTNLHLKSWGSFRDLHVPVLVKHAPNIEQLALPGSRITGVGVQQLVKQLESLRRLDLTDCSAMGIDAVDWARKQGIRVKFQLSQG